MIDNVIQVDDATFLKNGVGHYLSIGKEYFDILPLTQTERGRVFRITDGKTEVLLRLERREDEQKPG